MPVAASAVYFLNLRGDVLINRLYRDDVGGNMVDAFRMHIMQSKELGTCPVRQIGGCSFFYMRISNVYIVIVVSSNANVACAFKFVVEAVALFKSYFGGAFDEDAIRNNFVLIYELLDEIMDFGYPQNLSPEILKLYITQEGVRSPFSSKPADKPVPNATLQVTGAVGWRREGLAYKKNEVFLDIVESVNLLMSSKGSVLRCDVTGKILMKCFLSGMPDLKLGLNDKIGLEKESQLKSRPTKRYGLVVKLDDVTFHQCVNLTRFNSEKTVSFVPPDGEFELMKYRITEGVNLPFRVLPTIKELGRTRIEVNVKVKSVFGAKMFALGVVIKIPVPKQTAKTSFQVTSGRAKYNAAIDCLVWNLKIGVDDSGLFFVQAVALFKSYFGGAFDEDAIRNNFVLIYELLDEIMDFGYPQNLSPEILKLYITQEGVRSPFSSKPADKPVPNATLQVTGAVGWRREGLAYKKNEVFLDIVESVNLLMSSKVVKLDDVTFHQCVNLTRFNSEKTVSFVPPDGEFELMKYRITEGVNLPFRVLPTIKELGRTRIEINVKVKSVFGAKMFALGVVIKIPVPKQTAKTSFQVTSGRAKYNAAIDCLVWKIRKFPGQTEPTLSAEVELISTMTEKKSWTRPPIQMEFQVPMFTASGLRVRFLKVWEKSGYNTVEWVRYITKAGSYEIRC
ncbi:hypothetical protein C1H46_020846 [Malus baccata]|uniref:MHD domain-containing protein n=2 Tax=fabids TaxID=91835 RepID=A0A540M4B9_MALBA|nr:hypothetical protein C1H46_020846 [Malus baccata]